MIEETILKWLLPVLLGGILTTLGTMVKLMSLLKKNDLASLWSHLDEKMRRCFEKGYCDTDDRYCIDALWERYSALKGNHGVERKIQKCYELPKEEINYGRRETDK